jgi:hypothetical protein
MTVVTSCFPNGVKAQSLADFSTMQTTGRVTTTTTVKKPSGELCYGSVADEFHTDGTVTYTDASGNVVATGTLVLDGTASTETVTCNGGIPRTLQLTCLALPPGGSEGTCSF